MCWWKYLMLSMLNMFECDWSHISVNLNGYLGTDVARFCLLSIMYKHNEIECPNSITVQEKKYRQVSNIRRTKSQHFIDSRTAVFAEYLEARFWVENEDVVGAAPSSQLHLSDRQFHCLLGRDLYYRLYGTHCSLIKSIEMSFMYVHEENLRERLLVLWTLQ